MVVFETKQGRQSNRLEFLGFWNLSPRNIFKHFPAKRFDELQGGYMCGANLALVMEI